MATSGMASTQGQCESCSGTGEVGTEVGLMDCPDCGGSGVLPHPNVLVEWRVRDIEKARSQGADLASDVASDIRWLIAELRRARTALTEIASLADDAGDSDVAQRIRGTAGQALALFDLGASTT